MDHLARRLVFREVSPGEEERSKVSQLSHLLILADTRVTLQYVYHDEIHEQEKKFADLKGEIEEAHVLEGMPTLEAKRRARMRK